jgi:transaldolase
LIGTDTVNTIPEKTLNAFLDHGSVKTTLSTETKQYQDVLDKLDDQGININAVCKKLLDDGVVAFEKSFSSLLNAIKQKAKQS